jgi:5-(carboxyamino)imidazole ribonucleotide mutase
MSSSEAVRTVLILCGSPSDLEPALDCEQTLDELGIVSTIRVLSAHRTPEAAAECVKNAEKEGFGVLISLAGLSAHLAGMAAAHTLLPVIGVPLAVGPLSGVDALLASAQMPPGTPVATVGLNRAENAALLAARILSLSRPELREALEQKAARDRKRYEPERIRSELEKRREKRRESRKG